MPIPEVPISSDETETPDGSCKHSEREAQANSFEALLLDLNVVFTTQSATITKLIQDNQKLSERLADLSKMADLVGGAMSVEMVPQRKASGMSVLTFSPDVDQVLEVHHLPRGIFDIFGKWVDITGKFWGEAITIAREESSIVDDEHFLYILSPANHRIPLSKVEGSQHCFEFSLTTDGHEEHYSLEPFTQDILYVLDSEKIVECTLHREAVESWHMPNLWPMWAKDEDMLCDPLPLSSRRTMVVVQARTGEAVVTRSVGRMSFLAMRPNSVKRVIWDMLSTLLVFYDVLVLPLMAFALDLKSSHSQAGSESSSLEKNPFMENMDWITATFWTADMPMSFLTGYNAHGMVETRLTHIALHYIRSWFFCDLLIVCLDWTFLFLAPSNVSSSAAGFLRVTKTARFMRIFRALRLLRFVRVWGVVADALDHINSKKLQAASSVVLALLFIFLSTHYLACGWYLIGRLGMRDGARNWIEMHSIENTSLGYRYLTCLHWSLTQFTPAGMEVHPYNLGERMYSILVLLAAVVSFSSFLSTITTSITKVRALTAESTKQQNILRRYFYENDVSGDLGSRIWKNLRTNHFSKARMHRKDIDVLKYLPRELHTDLCKELFAPYITRIPFFAYMTGQSKLYLSDVCCRIVVESSTYNGEELFYDGKVAQHVYAICSGKMQYNHNVEDLSCKLSGGDWAAEPVLWLEWEHCGQLISVTYCELVAVESSRFRDLMSEHRSLLSFARSYAKAFLNRLKGANLKGRTDIWSKTAVDELVTIACEDVKHKADMMWISTPRAFPSSHIQRAMQSEDTQSFEDR